MANAGYEIGWDAAIENDSPGFVTLPNGDYDFEVVKFERGRHAGSDKLPPCNKAIVYLKIEGAEGETIVKENLHLHSITEGILCAFFTCIGQRKHGERVTMNWSAVLGSTGRARIGVNKWTGDDGVERTNNEVKKFLDPGESAQRPAPAQAKKFEAGRF